MKRYLGILVVLMILLNTACSTVSHDDMRSNAVVKTNQENAPVIVVDSELLANGNNSVLKYAQYLYEDYNVQFQILPSSSSERKMQISRLSVEIMSGGGPDGFILACDEAYLDDEGRKAPLFENVEKVMRLNIFMPMDDLIAKSEYLHMEDHQKVIMDAGKTEEGQMVLPLLYSCSAYFVEGQLTESDVTLNTWDDVLACEDQKLMSFIWAGRFGWFGCQYTQIADYDREDILISEEQIARDVEFLRTIGESSESLENMEPVYEIDADSLQIWEKSPESVTRLCVPNDTGGLTATISAYAAINRNSKYAEEVFRYIELLFAEEVQSDGGFSVPDPFSVTGERRYGANSRPSAALLGTGGGLATHKRAYSGAQGEFVCDLTEKVNAVRFCSDIEIELQELILSNYDETELQDATHDIHERISIMISE